MNNKIQDIIDRYPILKGSKGIEKDELFFLNKEYVRQLRRLINQNWFSKNTIVYYTNLEIA